ncbi:MAG: hypothetical protein Q9213_000495 [Squamulea squamosa]
MIQLQYFLTFFLLFISTIQGTPTGPRALSPEIQPCVASPDWVVSSHLNPSDCVEAIRMFRRAEYQKDGSQRFEFLAPGAHPISDLRALTTPRKHRFKSCTVAVAMFASIPPWLLPPTMERMKFAPTDIVSLDQIRQAAEQIVTTCVEYRKPLVGWQELGRLSKAIGVFVWETGSPIDRAVKPWYVLSRGGSANKTAVT